MSATTGISSYSTGLDSSSSTDTSSLSSELEQIFEELISLLQQLEGSSADSADSSGALAGSGSDSDGVGAVGGTGGSTGGCSGMDSADSAYGDSYDTSDSYGTSDSTDSYAADDSTDSVSATDSTDSSAADSTATGSSVLSSSAPADTQQYKQYIEEASQKYGVPADLIAAEIEQESSGNANATSTNPALGLPDEGLMQVDTNTYSSDIQKYDPSLTGTNLYDPKTNIMAGTAYLAELYKQDGSWSKALQDYNGGYDTSYVQEAISHLQQEGDTSLAAQL